MKIIKKENVFTIIIFLFFCMQGCEKQSSANNVVPPKSQPVVSQKPIIEEKQEIAQVSKKAKSKPQKAPKKELTGNVLAIVGDWSITMEDFKERLEALAELVPDYDINDKEATKLVLDELIRQQLLIEEAKKTGLDKDKDIVMAVEEFKRTLLVREMAVKLIDKVEVTDEEVKNFYDQNQKGFSSPDEWKVSEIVVFSEEEAKGVLIEVYQGADFSEIAALKSKGESSKKGGDLGFLKEFPFPKMKQVALALEIGDLSTVFKGPKGYYIIKLTDKKSGQVEAFEKVKEDIQEGLMNLKQQQTILNYLEGLRKKIPVEINEKLLEE